MTGQAEAARPFWAPGRAASAALRRLVEGAGTAFIAERDRWAGRIEHGARRQAVHLPRNGTARTTDGHEGTEREDGELRGDE